MHPQRHPVEGGLDRDRVGQHVEEVATRAPQHVELAGRRGLEHLGRGEPAVVGHREPPGVGQLAGRALVDLDAAGEGGGVGAHLGAALHARVAAQRHEPGAVATDVAPGQAEVHDGPHTVDRAAVLGDAHRPQQDGGVGRRVLVDELLDLGPGQPGLVEQLVERTVVEVGDQLVPPVGVGGDEGLVDRTPLDQQLERGAGEGHVATGPHRHVQVAHLRAEQGRLGVGRAPSSGRGRARGRG